MVLGLLCLACVAIVALGSFFFVGKYNTLITLRKHVLQGWIDLTAADLRLADELRNQGFRTEADLLEEVAHYAVAVFGQPSASEHLSSVRQHALTHKQDHREHLALTRKYEAKLNFYNATLRDPFCAFVARCCGLHHLPQSTRIISVPSGVPD